MSIRLWKNTKVHWGHLLSSSTKSKNTSLPLSWIGTPCWSNRILWVFMPSSHGSLKERVLEAQLHSASQTVGVCVNHGESVNRRILDQWFWEQGFEPAILTSFGVICSPCFEKQSSSLRHFLRIQEMEGNHRHLFNAWQCVWCGLHVKLVTVSWIEEQTSPTPATIFSAVISSISLESIFKCW